MSHIFMYAHGGSGNHGCEAIVRSTVNILKYVSKDRIRLITDRPWEDKEYGLLELCDLIQEKSDYSHMSFEFIRAYLQLKLTKNYIPLDKLQYKKSFDHMRPGDIALSIGGDNYCYADVQRYIMMHDMAIARGAKTVLWGCSVEPKLLEDSRIAADLGRYSLITARETISYEALKKVNSNTVLVCDPAFTLPCNKPLMPANFADGNMVGINLSPMIMSNESLPGVTIKSYEKLIEYILESTNMSIALIPHVVWEDGDDRIPLYHLYKKYSGSRRILMIEDQNCTQLKGVISRCRFFVGARTHATIAAYSTGVPTLVVGYSVKARGIAHDLFGSEENYVVPVQELTQANTLITKFSWIVENEELIREKLSKSIEIALQRAQCAYAHIARLAAVK